MAEPITDEPQVHDEPPRELNALSRKKAKEDREKAYGAMVRCLARREHSELELRRKLARKYLPAEIIDDIIDTLQDDNLQSDVRFAEDFVHAKIEAGYGYSRIRTGLRDHGIDLSIIAEHLSTDERVWFDLAHGALQKRYGDDDPIDYHGGEEKRVEWLKRAKFLQHRGFPRGMIANVLNGKPIEE